MDENKLLRVLMFSMVFVIFFLFAYIGVSTVARMDAATPKYAAVTGTVSYGYEEMSMETLNTWITTTADDPNFAAGDAVSKNVKITEGGDCYFSMTGGEVLGPDGNAFSPAVGNTYLITIKKTAAGGADKATAYFAKIAGTTVEGAAPAIGACGAVVLDKAMIAFSDLQGANEWMYTTADSAGKDTVRQFSDSANSAIQYLRITSAAFDSDSDGTLDSVLTAHGSNRGPHHWAYTIIKNGAEKTIDDQVLYTQSNHDIENLPVKAAAFDSDDSGSPDSVLVAYANYEGANDWRYTVVNSDGSLKSFDGKDYKIIADQPNGENMEFKGLTVAAFDSDNKGGQDKVFIGYADAAGDNKWRYSIVNSDGSIGTDNEELADETGEAFTTAIERKTVPGIAETVYVSGAEIVSVAFDPDGNSGPDKVLVAFADLKDAEEWRYSIINSDGLTKTKDNALLSNQAGEADIIKSKITAAAYDSDNDGTKDRVLLSYTNLIGDNSWKYSIIQSDGGLLTGKSDAELYTQKGHDIAYLPIKAAVFNAEDGTPDKILVAYANYEGDNDWRYSIINNDGTFSKTHGQLAIQKTDQDLNDADLSMAAFDSNANGVLDSVLAAYADKKADNWAYKIITAETISGENIIADETEQTPVNVFITTTAFSGPASP